MKKHTKALQSSVSIRLEKGKLIPSHIIEPKNHRGDRPEIVS